MADTDAGHYCEERQNWLRNILNQTSNNYKIYIFMHHNPLALAQEKSDAIGLQEKKAFKKILLNSKKNNQMFHGPPKKLRINSTYVTFADMQQVLSDGSK